MYLFLPSLKVFYIDKCLYIAVETFTNNKFYKFFEKKFHYSFDTDLENVQFYMFSLLLFLKG